MVVIALPPREVQVYSSKSLQIVKTISRFKEVAYSGSFRDDGKLLIAGGDEGVIRLFDVEGKALLRVFKGHDGPVHTTKFLKDRIRLFSGSDDNSVCMWDIPSETDILSYKEHKDYVRCGVASVSSSDIVLTGSYDHTVKMYDARIPESVLTVDHGHPVESVVMFPSGGIFVSAGGNVVRVWDALAGGKLLTTLCHHHKQVMSLAFCSNYQRLLSASLDRHVKIYDVSTYQVVHTLDYPGTVISAAVSPDDSLLVVGSAEGLVSIQRRKPEESNIKRKKNKHSYKFTLQGKTHVPQNDDYFVDHKRKEQLSKYDQFFKRFEYTKALDAAMDPRIRMQSPEVTISVMQELVRRGGIKTALAGRDEKSLGYLFRFIEKNICKPRYLSTLIDICNLLLDLYSNQLGQSPGIDALLLGLRNTVKSEVDLMKQFFETMGTMDTLFSASSQTDLANQVTETNTDADRLLPSQAAQSL